MTNALDFILLNVFSDRLAGGNQLAVFPSATGLSPENMAIVGRELKVNETVFVTGEMPDGFTARIFSPHGELPFAGHPIIGTACLLAEQIGAGCNDLSFALHVPAGAVPVRVGELHGTPAQGARHAMLRAPTLPKKLDVSIDPAMLALMLGLEEPAVIGGKWKPAAFSAGIPFLCVLLSSRDALSRARLNKGIWSASLEDSAAPHLYIFCLEEDGTIHARMFAPAVGIEEDPATGAAAVALGGFLAAYATSSDGTFAFKIHQGVEIGRPSIIDLEITVIGGIPVVIEIGGHSVYLGHGSLSPDLVT